MRKLDKNAPQPKGEFFVAKMNGYTYVYEEGDQEYIALILPFKKENKRQEIAESYIRENRKIEKFKDKHNTMRDCLLAGVGFKGKTHAETQIDFKKTTEKINSIEQKRDSLLAAIDAATTLDEVHAVTW